MTKPSNLSIVQWDCEPEPQCDIATPPPQAAVSMEEPKCNLCYVIQWRHLMTVWRKEF